MAVRRLRGGLYTTVRQLTGMINDLAALANELKTELNAVTTKLDADAGGHRHELQLIARSRGV